MIKKIVAATDGSVMSRKAVNYASELAKQLGAALTLVGVIDSDYLFAPGISPEVSPTNIRESTEDVLRRATEAYLDQSVAECRARELDVPPGDQDGPPGRGDRQASRG